MNRFTSELTVLEQAVIAGAMAMNGLLKAGTAVETNRKDDQSIVMNLDLASQESMRTAIGSTGLVVSEEDPESHHHIKDSGSYFLIDPLDGTSSCRRCLMNHGRFVAGNVGFGPLAGYVWEGTLVAAAFLNLPDRALYTAERGGGSWVVELNEEWAVDPAQERCRIRSKQQSSLADAATLYYPGKKGEMDFAKYLLDTDSVDSIYRFGSFANDCTRLAKGYEQLEIQFSPKAWDLSAALISEEAGCSVIVDPLDEAVLLAKKKVSLRNPVLIAAPGLEGELREVLKRYRARFAAGIDR